METFCALLALCAGNSLVTGEFPSQRPVMRSFDATFDLCRNKRLSKQSLGWWFETPSRSLSRHCNVSTLTRVMGVVVWRHQAITWTVRSTWDQIQKGYARQPSIVVIRLKITSLKISSNLTGTSELIRCVTVPESSRLSNGHDAVCRIYQITGWEFHRAFACTPAGVHPHGPTVQCTGMRVNDYQLIIWKNM